MAEFELADDLLDSEEIQPGILHHVQVKKSLPLDNFSLRSQ